MTPVSYQPILPVVAAWSLEFPEAVAVVFVQIDGTDVNIVGSRLWRFTALSTAIAELSDFPWRKRIESHVIPPDPGGVWAGIFEDAGIEAETCPDWSEIQTVFLTRELFAVLRVDNEPRPWTCEDEEENNQQLIESINGYRVEQARNSETFGKTAAHSWERYLVRALEVFALWHHNGASAGFGPKPSNELYNRGVI